MILILLITLLSTLMTHTTLLGNSSYYAKILQQLCVDFLPASSNHPTGLASLVCGTKVTDNVTQITLMKTSLLHIFIVSGSHLLFIDQFFSKIKFPVPLRAFFLTCYTLLTGFQAPALRALLHLTSKQFLNFHRLRFHSDFSTLLSGFFTLLLIPTWWQSRSLQLSWLASLALCLPSLFPFKNSFKKILATQAALYFFLIPALWGFGNLHPLSIVFNLLLAPLIGLVLFPLALLCVASPSLIPIFDSCMDGLNFIGRSFTDPVQLQKFQPLDNLWIWFWLFFLHIAFMTLKLKLRKGRDPCHS